MLAIDRRNGLRAGRDCPEGFVDAVPSLVPDAQLAPWVDRIDLATAPTTWSPLCPGGPDSDGTPQLRQRLLEEVVFAAPAEGARFRYDPDVAPSARAVTVRLAGNPMLHRVRLTLDGKPFVECPIERPCPLPLEPGRWTLGIDGGNPNTLVSVDVEFVASKIDDLLKHPRQGPDDPDPTVASPGDGLR
jgi:hypothetical protein